MPLPTETPTVEPTPTEPEPVALEVDVVPFNLSDDDFITTGAEQTPMDQAAIDRLAERLTELVEAHLDARNVGEPGALDVLLAPLDPMTGEPGALLAPLASPDNPAVAAAMGLRVGVDGEPKWAQATLTVSREDDSIVTRTLVIAVDMDPWQLVLVGPEGDA